MQMPGAAGQSSTPAPHNFNDMLAHTSTDGRTYFSTSLRAPHAASASAATNSAPASIPGLLPTPKSGDASPGIAIARHIAQPLGHSQSSSSLPGSMSFHREEALPMAEAHIAKMPDQQPTMASFVRYARCICPSGASRAERPEATRPISPRFASLLPIATQCTPHSPVPQTPLYLGR